MLFVQVPVWRLPHGERSSRAHRETRKVRSGGAFGKFAILSKSDEEFIQKRTRRAAVGASRSGHKRSFTPLQHRCQFSRLAGLLNHVEVGKLVDIEARSDETEIADKIDIAL